MQHNVGNVLEGSREINMSLNKDIKLPSFKKHVYLVDCLKFLSEFYLQES